MSDADWLEALARQLRLDDTIAPSGEEDAPQQVTLVDLAEALEITPDGWDAVQQTITDRATHILDDDPNFFTRMVADDPDLLLALVALVQYIMALVSKQVSEPNLVRGTGYAYALAFAIMARRGYERGRREASDRY